jgi:single-strand DNA-binding protein
VWREFGEHVASSLTKGSRVIAQGRLRQRQYETQEGEKRTSMELEIDEIGPSLRYATAQVTKTVKSSGAPSGIPTGADAVEAQWGQQGQQQGDVWSSSGGYADEKPF